MDLDMDRLQSQLILEEGLRLAPYDDSTGYPVPAGQKAKGSLTIGVGRNLDTNPFTLSEQAVIGHNGRSKPITHDQALLLLDNDIHSVEIHLDKYIPWWDTLDEIRARVLVDLCFNMGIGKLLTFQKFLDTLNEGDYDDAANNLQTSLWFHQVGSRGKRLVAMIRTGDDWTA